MPNNRNRNRKGKGKGPSKAEMRDFAADYGWAMSVFEEFPQLYKVFKQAVDKEWSPQRFVAEIQDTPWFRRHSDAWRQATYLQLTDPETYNKRVSEIYRQIQDAAGSLGLEPGNKQIKEWAEQAFRFGWDQTKINNKLAGAVQINGQHTVGGSLADSKDALEKFAWDNGIHINGGTMRKWLQQIVRGNSTPQEYQQYITKMAKAKHPNWARELEAGMTMAEIAEPYKQTMAQMLELNPAQVEITNNAITHALTNRNEKTGEYETMSLTKFQDMLRRDPRWQYTDNARQTVNQITAGLLQSFGELA